MNALEESFAHSLASCEALLDLERSAIEKSDADGIESILSQKDAAFEELRKTGESLGFSPTENPEFSTRIEKLFASLQENLELMQEILSGFQSEASEIHQGKARLRMVKGAYLPSSSSTDRYPS
tara:strand:+ start:429 stop:800 length:372 start_codon:yes stop_codon:yes gene_type:complete